MAGRDGFWEYSVERGVEVELINIEEEFSPEFTRRLRQGGYSHRPYGKGPPSGAAERFRLLVEYNGVVLPG